MHGQLLKFPVWKKKKKKKDSCPAEKMLLIFMWGLCYDERYIAEFIFICLGGKSEPRQWDTWLMNTLGWESIRIYIPHQEHLNVLEGSNTKLAFTLHSFKFSVQFSFMFSVCLLISRTFKYTESHMVMTFFCVCVCVWENRVIMTK